MVKYGKFKNICFKVMDFKNMCISWKNNGRVFSEKYANNGHIWQLTENGVVIHRIILIYGFISRVSH